MTKWRRALRALDQEKRNADEAVTQRNQRRSNLCSRCSEIDFHAELNHSRTFLELTLAEAKAQQDCAFCRLICTYSEELLRNWGRSELRNVWCCVRGHVFLTTIEYSTTVRSEACVGNRGFGVDVKGHGVDGNFESCFYIDVLPQKTGPGVSAVPLTVTRRQIPEQFDRSNLRRWLDQDDRHDTAGRSPMPHSLLILIATRQFRAIDVIADKVIALSEPVRYLALSYVWGHRTPEQTMACQLAMDGELLIADLVSLPRTMKDTIEFVRLLGERYLWIDAMCIHPDDTADVIPCMGAIYAAAYLTVIAAHGEDTNAGLGRLSGRPTLTERPIILWKKGQSISLLELRKPTLESRLLNTAWSTRAGTFQEWLVSERTVISNEDEVSFHSRSGYVREAYELHPDPPRPRIWRSLGRRLNLNPPNTPALLEIGASRGNLFEPTSYRDLVHKFTARVSTYPGDRLDAFIGVLEQFEPATESMPSRIALCGLSRNNFVQSLAWSSWVAPSFEVVRIPQDHRKIRNFPSWSWFSVSGLIRITTSTFKREFEVLDDANIRCNLAGLPWGVEPSVGELTSILSVTLAPVDWTNPLQFRQSKVGQLWKHSRRIYLYIKAP